MGFKETSKKFEFVALIDEIRYTKNKNVFTWKSSCHWDALCELLALAWEDGYNVGKLKANAPEPVETWKEDHAESSP